MKTLVAAFFATAAMVGVAKAEIVTGTLQSFDQVTGTIVLDNGVSYGIDLNDDDSNGLISPIASGTSVTLRLDDGTKQVTDIYPSS